MTTPRAGVNDNAHGSGTGSKQPRTGHEACDSLAAETSRADNENFFKQVNIEFLVHELKDPVSLIETSARMLLDKQGPTALLTPDQQRSMQRILRNTHKTRDMLNELLEVGRAQNACFHCRPFKPHDVLRHLLITTIESSAPELVEPMGQKPDIQSNLTFLASRGIRLDVTPAAESAIMEQDEIKFRQIVGNLFKNAFYYRRHHLLIHLACQHKWISVAVRDDGPGIASAHHELIFQRYKQITPHASMARSGHGLGLAVARILARSMGGDITLESELGQGAVFRLNLPCAFEDRTDK
jgi:two-component system, OmpR family, sensor kinase